MSFDRVLDERIQGWLAEAPVVRLATVTPRGRPHVAPFWFHSDGARIVISTLENQTVRNLRANPECAVLVDLGTDFKDLRGALIRGRARLLKRDATVPEDVRAALDAIDRAHAAELDEPEFARYQAWETRPKIVLDIEPLGATWFDLGLSDAGRTGSAHAGAR